MRTRGARSFNTVRETPAPERARVRDAVRTFYEALPFNYHGGVESSAEAVEANPVAAVYPDLHTLLASGRVRRALELGCGAGWLTNTLAMHYGVRMTAIDFTAPALARARDVARRLGVTGSTEFIEADLFTYQSPTPFDLVVSMGVLHHTGDARGGVLHAASLVAPGGHVCLTCRGGVCSWMRCRGSRRARAKRPRTRSTAHSTASTRETKR